MIVANKRYLDNEEEVYPDMETFFNKKNQYYQKCRVYGVCTAYEALQKECADIAELFKNRYPDNNCYYDVSKIGDGMYIVEENHKTSESGFHHCYYPYVEGYPAVFTEYNTFEDAILAALALKLNGYRSCLNDNRVYFAKQILSARRCNNG